MTNCWIWLGGRSRNGYGHLRWQRKTVYAHRVMWELANGPIPEGWFVCHRCDNTLCVRPDHLFVGTAADNAHDMVVKGRSARGETHSQSTLTATQVEEIRSLYAGGTYTQQQLAHQFNTRDGNISRIIRGERWKHIPGADPREHRHFTAKARKARHSGHYRP